MVTRYEVKPESQVQFPLSVTDKERKLVEAVRSMAFGKIIAHIEDNRIVRLERNTSERV